MLQFTIDDSRCTRCRQCVRDCPARIINQKRNEAPFIAAEQEASCLRCQHCLAVCPSGALSILGHDPAASLPLTPEALPTPAQLTRLACGRRSVRQYRDENVDPALLRELVAATAHAPTGGNRCPLTFLLIDDKEVMAGVACRPWGDAGA